MAGNSRGYVKGTWSWVGGGRGEDGRESRGVEEMTGLWEESDGTGGAATSDQREKAPGGLAGWAAGRQVESGEWREMDGGRAGLDFAVGADLQWTVDRPPKRAGPSQMRAPQPPPEQLSSAASEQRPPNQASSSQVGQRCKLETGDLC